jgi:hypothetical protein
MENNNHRWCNSSDFLYADNDSHADVYLLCISLLTRNAGGQFTIGFPVCVQRMYVNLYGR